MGGSKQSVQRLYFIQANTLNQCNPITLEAFALDNMCYESTDDLSDFSDDSFDSKMENDFTITNHADIHEACEQRKEISEKQC